MFHIRTHPHRRAPGLIVAGSSHVRLARDVARSAEWAFADVTREHFKDGDCYVRIVSPIRGRDVAILQSGHPNVQEHFTELLMLVDAVRREHPRRITALLPFFPFRRGDHTVLPGESVSGSVVARSLEAVGVQRVVSVDLHKPRIASFFRGPVTNGIPYAAYVRALRRLSLLRPIVIGADDGTLHRARHLGTLLGADATAFTKTRGPRHDRVAAIHLRRHVRGYDVILVDDEISTGGTIIACAKRLRAGGARSITVVVAHGVFAASAPSALQHSAVDRVFVTDTIAIPSARRFPKLTILPIAPLLAEALVAS